MKRALHIICLILAVLLVCGGIRISSQLPMDKGEFVEKKYAGWSGVLRGWVMSRWNCSGNFTAWLNRCAAAFEKKHEGVYLEFTAVDGSVLAGMGSGLRAPELLFFSPGVIADGSIFTGLSVSADFKPGLSAQGAVPLAMGAYIAVQNTALPAAGTPALLPDDSGRCFSRAAELMQSSPAPSEEIELPDSGIDLGLPAMANDTDALQDFINGEIPSLLVSQKELARLIRLQDAGRGPDWCCLPAGSQILADQLLLGGALVQTDEAAPQRTPLAEEFLLFLLEEECQMQLADIGAFPVTRLRTYGGLSAYADMEEALLGSALLVPQIFTQ